MTTEQFEDANAKRTDTADPVRQPANAAAGTLRAKDRPYSVRDDVLRLRRAAPARRPRGARRAPGRAAAQRAHDVGRRPGRAHHREHRRSPASTPRRSSEVQARVDEIAALARSCRSASTASSSRRTWWPTRPRPGPAPARRAGPSRTSCPPWRRSPSCSAWSGTWAAPASSRPRAVLEPVEIDGRTVTYATLHNPADITRRDLRSATA